MGVRNWLFDLQVAHEWVAVAMEGSFCKPQLKTEFYSY